MHLKGKTTLVTGAANRIGKAIALGFARSGSNIILHYFRSENEARITQKEIQKLGVTCRLAPGDFSSPENVEEFIKNHGKHLESVSILVNSASIFHETPLEKLTASEAEKFLDIHLLAAMRLGQMIGLHLREKKEEGVIINITDARLLSPYRGHAPYFAAKAALENLTHTLARELAPHVRVNTVAPGVISFPENYSEEKKQAIIKKIPLGRPGSPEDIANACVFLAQASYVNGASLVIDGGRSLH